MVDSGYDSLVRGPGDEAMATIELNSLAMVDSGYDSDYGYQPVVYSEVSCPTPLSLFLFLSLSMNYSLLCYNILM